MFIIYTASIASCVKELSIQVSQVACVIAFSPLSPAWLVNWITCLSLSASWLIHPSLLHLTFPFATISLALSLSHDLCQSFPLLSSPLLFSSLLSSLIQCKGLSPLLSYTHSVAFCPSCDCVTASVCVCVSVCVCDSARYLFPSSLWLWTDGHFFLLFSSLFFPSPTTIFPSSRHLLQVLSHYDTFLFIIIIRFHNLSYFLAVWLHRVSPWLSMYVSVSVSVSVSVCLMYRVLADEHEVVLCMRVLSKHPITRESKCTGETSFLVTCLSLFLSFSIRFAWWNRIARSSSTIAYTRESLKLSIESFVSMATALHHSSKCTRRLTGRLCTLLLFLSPFAFAAHHWNHTLTSSSLDIHTHTHTLT